MFGTPIVLIVRISKRLIFNNYMHVLLEGQRAEQEDSVLSHSLAVSGSITSKLYSEIATMTRERRGEVRTGEMKREKRRGEQSG